MAHVGGLNVINGEPEFYTECTRINRRSDRVSPPETLRSRCAVTDVNEL